MPLVILVADTLLKADAAVTLIASSLALMEITMSQSSYVPNQRLISLTVTVTVSQAYCESWRLSCDAGALTIMMMGRERNSVMSSHLDGAQSRDIC
jgi:hypothetical protein